MKLARVTVVCSLGAVVLASVSNINLSPIGNYAQVSPKGGLYASVTILIYMIFSELGYLPFRFKGRKKRSAVSQLLDGDNFSKRNSALKMIQALDQKNCILRFLCELEAYRTEALANNSTLDPDLESDLILLKVAKRDKHPALLMREDPGSPALPFEIAIYTGSQGLDSCSNLFHTCPYNITTMQTMLGEDFDTDYQ